MGISTDSLPPLPYSLTLGGNWDRETIDGQDGTRYYRRINVEASCLACHGGKAHRPQFVKDKYPQDLAYDFKVGDLRGMYAVFIPDLQQGLKDAVSLVTVTGKIL